MATSKESPSQALTEETLTKIERDLQSKERLLVQEYGTTDVDLDIAKHLAILKSSSPATAANELSVMQARRKLDQKRRRAKANNDLITKNEPMKIPSEISNDTSLVHPIKILDEAFNMMLGFIH